MVYFYKNASQTLPYASTTSSKIRVRNMRHKTSISSSLRQPNVGEISINSASDFYNIRNNLSASYILMSDIDLSSYADWTPIGYNYSTAFTGDLDGNGHTITGLTMSSPSTGQYLGLFAHAVNATFSNVKLFNASVTTTIEGALFIGYSESCTYTDCKVTGTYNKTANRGEAAGFVAYDYDSTFIRCGADCTVINLDSTNDSWAGVFAGDLDGSNSITDCYAKGSVTGTHRTGGFCGEASSVYIIQSYSAVNITSSGTYQDAFFGNPISYTAQNCYWDGEITTKTSVLTTSERTTAQMKTQSNYSSLWDFSTVWNIDGTTNDGYPFLRNETSVSSEVMARGVWHKSAGLTKLKYSFEGNLLDSSGNGYNINNSSGTISYVGGQIGNAIQITNGGIMLDTFETPYNPSITPQGIVGSDSSISGYFKATIPDSPTQSLYIAFYEENIDGSTQYIEINGDTDPEVPEGYSLYIIYDRSDSDNNSIDYITYTFNDKNYFDNNWHYFMFTFNYAESRLILNVDENTYSSSYTPLSIDTVRNWVSYEFNEKSGTLTLDEIVCSSGTQNIRVNA